MALLETTLKLLEACKAKGMKPKDVVAATHGAIDIEWLYKFWRGDIPDPRISTLQRVHDELKKISKPN
jgi:predicted transcriptional regulator